MRSDLRLDDLRGRKQVASKLMNVKIPAEVSNRIHKVADTLKASKTEVVIALLNEGLAASSGLLKKYRIPKAAGAPRPGGARRGRHPAGRKCSVSGCGRAHVAKGYCANHYQAWRRGALKK